MKLLILLFMFPFSSIGQGPLLIYYGAKHVPTAQSNMILAFASVAPTTPTSAISIRFTEAAAVIDTHWVAVPKFITAKSTWYVHQLNNGIIKNDGVAAWYKSGVIQAFGTSYTIYRQLYPSNYNAILTFKE